MNFVVLILWTYSKCEIVPIFIVAAINIMLWSHDTKTLYGLVHFSPLWNQNYLASHNDLVVTRQRCMYSQTEVKWCQTDYIQTMHWVHIDHWRVIVSTLVYWDIQMTISTTDDTKHWSTDLKMTSHGPTIDCTLTSQFAPFSCSQYMVADSCDQSITGRHYYVQNDLPIAYGHLPNKIFVMS